MTTSPQPRLGIDIGRVIIDGSSHPNGGDTAFFQGDEATMLATPEMDGAFEAIARLVPLFGGEAWLVSKCGDRVQARTRRWLRAHRFFERTGIAPDNLRFCRRRPEKRDHCLDLQLTHFVDDRPDVHEAISDVVDHRFLFGPQPNDVPAVGIHVRTWAEAEPAVMATLR